VKCANEEFDLPLARIKDVIKAFNALYKNQGLNEMIKLWNERDDKNGKKVDGNSNNKLVNLN